MKFVDTINEDPRLQFIFIIGFVFIVIIIGMFFWLVFRPLSPSGLQPWLPEPTAGAVSEGSQPQNLSFDELNNDPLTYLHQEIQVTGSFLPLEKPACQNFTGPFPLWALVSENLQLDVIGFERILELVEPGTSMVVQGTWQNYEGPLGCGKGPERGNIWYLEVKKVIQPNPLVASGGTGSGVTIIGPDPSVPTAVPVSPTPIIIEPSPTIDPLTPTQSSDLPSPTAPTDATVTFTPVPPGTLIPTATASTLEPPVTATPLTATPLTATPTIPGTQGPGGSDPTLTPETPPPLPPATATNGEPYQGPPPTQTPMPTATPEGYP